MARLISLLFFAVCLLPSVRAQELPAPRVYPNPSAAGQAITVQVEDAREARLELIDVRGRVVEHAGPLAAGTYFVRIRYANGTVSEPAPITLVAGGRRAFSLIGATPEPMSAAVGAGSHLGPAAPEITPIPTDSLGIGDVEVGLSRQDTVRVKNEGTADLTVSSATLATGGAFSLIAGASGGVVPVDDTLLVVVSFAPTSVGAQSDTLTLASDDADEPSLRIELTGTGTAPAMPEVDASTDSLGFGMVVVGNTQRDTVTVRNVGTAALSISALTLATGGDVSIESGGGSTSLPAGDSVQVALAYTPSAVGAVSDTLRIVSDDADEATLNVVLTGTGMAAPAPEITVSPDSLGLGEVAVGMMAQDTVTVRNEGTADLDVTSIALAYGTTFTILGGGSATLVTPGDSVSVVVQFAPASEGAFADTLTIASDDDDEPSVQVVVTGTGTPPPAPDILVAPDSLGFGEVQQTLTAQDTVMVRNEGTATLSLSSIALASGSVFSILSGGDTASILAGDSAAVVLQFAPLADGLVTDTLSIESDDADTPTARVVLSGVGTPPPAPVILVTPDSLGFGEVVENTIAQDTVTVRNVGDAPLDVTSIALATGSVFTILEGPTGSVAAGDSLSIVVQFAPLAVGVETDTLTVESDDAAQPSARVVLSGTGVAPPAPEISVATDSLGFGDVRTDAVAQDSVRILNEGTADLSLSSIALASGTAFSILAGGDPAVLVPGDSAFVVVQFAPSLAGAQTDTLSIASDDADEALVRVELTGTGIGVPSISVAPDSLGLGAIEIGAMAHDTVTVRNVGTGDLSLSSLALSAGTVFTILSGGDPGTLVPGDSASVVVQFAPLAEGAAADTLTVDSDDETSPSLTVVVTGTGVGEPEVDADLTPLAFGTVTIGEMPQDTVVVRNLGNGSLAVSSVTIGGAAPDAYEILAGGEGGVVAPGDSLSIVVGFGPILETEQLATLTIATDDADEPTLEIPLSGTGDSPGYVFLYVMGDSQAAGKGDPTTSCDLRPNAGRRGWVYRRAFDEYVPVCDPVVDDLYNGSVLPSLVDEVYEQHNKIALVIFYTIKGTNLTPEAAGDELYWYIGDDSTAAGQAFDNGKIVLKKAKRAAQRDFAGQPVEPLAGIHSFGGLDARKWYEQGLGGPETSFRPRLSFFDFVISASNVQPLYFEIARAPGKPQFDAPLDTFAAVMRDVVPADRVLDYADYVNAQEAIDQLGYGEANWWADKSGHLGSRGLDYLGTVIAQAIDP